MQDRPCVLVVEDELIVAMDIVQSLASMGFEARGGITTGEEALEEMRRSIPDLVIMDIRLAGELDGVQVARQIREHYSTPVIFVTASTEKSTFLRAVAERPLAVLTKPFNASEVKRLFYDQCSS